MRIITGYTGEKHITPADDASLHKGIFGDGDYVLPTGSQFEATIQSNTEIRIADGDLVMQGRHARIDSGYESLTIENGSQGMYRNDLIVARYSKDSSTSVEAISLAVIKGTAVSGSAVDPNYNKGDINNGETREFPLYRVVLNGINIALVTPLFEVKDLSRTDYAGFEKLWENASPKSNFPAQKLTFDGEYDAVILTAGFSTEYIRVANMVVVDLDATYTNCLLSVMWETNVARLVDITKTETGISIDFKNGGQYGSYGGSREEGSSYCIPLTIYGLKGVQ